MKNILNSKWSAVFTVLLFMFIMITFKVDKVSAEALVKENSEKVLRSVQYKPNKVIKLSSIVSSSGKRSLSRGEGFTEVDSREQVRKEVVSFAYKFIGRPYVWGASGSKAFDCSGFTSYVYRNFGIYLPHQSGEQASMGRRVQRGELKKGDLVFFGDGGISHVGIYIGDGQFIHASSGSRKVITSDLDGSYYSSHYKGARRVYE